MVNLENGREDLQMDLSEVDIASELIWFTQTFSKEIKSTASGNHPIK